MSACTARPTYGLAELLALVVSILRPWLDAIRTEFARPTPSAAPAPTPVPAPQVEPVASLEPVADTPVVVEVVPAVEPVTVAEVAELPAVAVVVEAAALEYAPPAVEVPLAWELEPVAGEVLYVKRGAGRGARYAPAEAGDRGPKFRRKMIGTTRVSYVRA